MAEHTDENGRGQSVDWVDWEFYMNHLAQQFFANASSSIATVAAMSRKRKRSEDAQERSDKTFPGDPAYIALNYSEPVCTEDSTVFDERLPMWQVCECKNKCSNPRRGNCCGTWGGSCSTYCKCIGWYSWNLSNCRNFWNLSRKEDLFGSSPGDRKAVQIGPPRGRDVVPTRCFINWYLRNMGIGKKRPKVTEFGECDEPELETLYRMITYPSEPVLPGNFAEALQLDEALAAWDEKNEPGVEPSLEQKQRLVRYAFTNDRDITGDGTWDPEDGFRFDVCSYLQWRPVDEIVYCKVCRKCYATGENVWHCKNCKKCRDDREMPCKNCGGMSDDLYEERHRRWWKSIMSLGSLPPSPSPGAGVRDVSTQPATAGN